MNYPQAFGRALPLIVAWSLIACGASGPLVPDPPSGGSTNSIAIGPPASIATVAPQAPPDEIRLRLARIGSAIQRWRQADNLKIAKAAAEEARNLIVGPGGPYYGDADRNGFIAGASKVGLLPGLKGETALVEPEDGACVVRDVLGGSWREPAKRWSTLDAAIRSWTVSKNTFPSLPSHPQRIVGWATLALSTKNLGAAREYGGHARLHIDITRKAVTHC